MPGQIRNPRTKVRPRRPGAAALCALAVAAAVALTACGSSPSSGSTGSSSSGSSPSGSSALSHKSLGLLVYINSVEGNYRPANATEAAAKAAGWTVTRIDGQGNPANFTQAMNQFVQDKLDAAALMWVPANLVAPQLAQAKSQGMKVADLLSGPSNLQPWLDISYNVGAMSDLYVTAFHKAMPNGGTIYGIVDNNVTAPRQLWTEVQQKLKARYPNIRVVGEHQADVQNLNADVSSAVSTALTQYPHLGCFFSVADAEGTPILSALATAHNGKNVCVVSSNGQKEFLDAIRAGRNVTDVAIGFEEGGYQLVDALLAEFAGKPIPAADKQLHLLLIDKSNVPQAGQSYEGQPGYVQMFTSEWKQQYGIGS